MLSILKYIIKFLFAPKEIFRILYKDYWYLKNKKNIIIKPIFISSYPKSGSTFLENSLVENSLYNSRVLIGNKKKIREHFLTQETFKFNFLKQNSVYKTHIEPIDENINILKKNNFDKIILNYRHPCDSFISLFHYEKKYPSWKKGDLFFSEKLVNEFTFENFFTENIDKYLNHKFWWINNWKKNLKKNNIDYLEIRYEDLLLNKFLCLNRITNFYDLSEEIFKDKKFKTIYLQNSKIPGFKNTFRKGEINNYVAQMSKHQKKYVFDKYKNEFKSLNYHCEL